MKLTEKIIVEVITSIVGEEVISLVLLLKDNSNLSEFDIAQKLGQPVDLTRNQLYRLYNNNVVHFIRKKDKQKGWYIYYWNVNPERILFLVGDIKRKRLEKRKEWLQREEGSLFFSCEEKCIRVDFESATNFDYKCPECGELLEQEDNSKRIAEIKIEIEELEEFVANEDKKLAKEEKKREDEELAEISKLEEEKAEKAAKKAAKKITKKTTKKTVKKASAVKKTVSKKATTKTTTKKSSVKKVVKKKK